MALFSGIYSGKTVFITGHTGFKGAWLCHWLQSMGASVVGYSIDIPTTPSLFAASGLETQITHTIGDVRDLEHLQLALTDAAPDMVFHLAAQPLVKKSYDDPIETFSTNVMGTVNVLEAIRHTPSVKAAIIITSDKCYRNVEWEWGYRESDALGGDDPYSGSKGAAELVARSYIASYFSSSETARVATVRAGNVIGGGDWAEDRIIPDSVRAWSNGDIVTIRSPNSTRPWQHVLEPLSGYLQLGEHLLKTADLHGESFNFGPDAKVNETVAQLLDAFGAHWEKARWQLDKAATTRHENTLLKLSCDKALYHLNWHAVWDFDATIGATAQWYRSFYDSSENTARITAAQIQAYCQSAAEQGLPWAN
jgi:CDP-glucose 4,6-dehydratase